MPSFHIIIQCSNRVVTLARNRISTWEELGKRRRDARNHAAISAGFPAEKTERLAEIAVSRIEKRKFAICDVSQRQAQPSSQ